MQGIHWVGIIAAGMLGLVAGAHGLLPVPIGVDQDRLCEVPTIDQGAVAAICKPGQKVIFLPPVFGNEQLPVVFAAMHCDLRHTVVMTVGAVTCIYRPLQMPKAEPPDQSPPASAGTQGAR